MADDLTLKALEFARDTSKDLVTLATGTIALSITFLKEVYRHVKPVGHRLLVAGWLLLCASILFGVIEQLAIVGNTDIAARPPKNGLAARTVSPYEGNVRTPAVLQTITFVAGMGLLISFGALSRLRRPSKPRLTSKQRDAAASAAAPAPESPAK